MAASSTQVPQYLLAASSGLGVLYLVTKVAEVSVLRSLTKTQHHKPKFTKAQMVVSGCSRSIMLVSNNLWYGIISGLPFVYPMLCGSLTTSHAWRQCPCPSAGPNSLWPTCLSMPLVNTLPQWQSPEHCFHQVALPPQGQLGFSLSPC
jgi:hypothetical protein